MDPRERKNADAHFPGVVYKVHDEGHGAIFGQDDVIDKIYPADRSQLIQPAEYVRCVYVVGEESSGEPHKAFELANAAAVAEYLPAERFARAIGADDKDVPAVEPPVVTR
jgi:hypothetical protein